jgi:hypothetical protein
MMADAVTAVVAVLALLVAVYAAVGTTRQAKEAKRANEVAEEALRVARTATSLEQDRWHVENRPSLSLVVDKRASKVQPVSLTCAGPVAYDELTLEVEPGHEDLVEGFMEGVDPTVTVDSTGPVPPVEVGREFPFRLARTDVDRTGRISVVAHVRKGHHSWRVVLPVELKRPPRVWGV